MYQNLKLDFQAKGKQIIKKKYDMESYSPELSDSFRNAQKQDIIEKSQMQSTRPQTYSVSENKVGSQNEQSR